MHFIPAAPDSWFNLPRQGGVAYAAQESWVENDTIRNNILFGSEYDEARYKAGEELLYCTRPNKRLTSFYHSHQTMRFAS